MGLLALLVMVAGCQSALPLGTEVQEAPGTTSKPVTAPGLTADGVRDADRLAKAHQDSLMRHSYTLRTTITIDRTDGGSMVMTRALFVGEDHERFLFRQRVRGDIPFSGVNRPDRNLTVWSDGNRAYARVVDQGGSRYSVTSPAIGWRMLHGGQALRTYFSRSSETRLSRLTYRGWAAYRIVATPRGSPSRSNGHLRAVAVINTFGHIFTIRIRGPATTLDWIPGTGHVRIKVEYDAIGDTTVPTPSWVRTARNETTD